MPSIRFQKDKSVTEIFTTALQKDGLLKTKLILLHFRTHFQKGNIYITKNKMLIPWCVYHVK